MSEPRFIKETLMATKQIIQRELARYSKVDLYFQEFPYASICSELLANFKYLSMSDDENELKQIFGDNWKNQLSDVMIYLQIVSNAQSTILLAEDKLMERNLSDPQYISLIAQMSQLNEIKLVNGIPDTLRLNVKRFVTTLLSHTDVGQRSIPTEAYYEAQKDNPHLQFDAKDEQFRKQKEKEYRIEQKLKNEY